MLGVAEPTAYDLRFRLLGIPVRVHPLFWLVLALLSGQDNDFIRVALFVGCGFVSILVHEFGHGLMARYFGYRSSEIVLFWMGGYCACDLDQQRPKERLAVLAAGPGAQFVLLAVVFLIGRLALGIGWGDDLEMMRVMLGIGSARGVSPSFFALSSSVQLVYLVMIAINLLWSLINLLPILPLDGGRIMETLLTMYRRRQGMRWAHVVSLLTAGVLAIIFFRSQQLGAGIWFAYFGFRNYQVLQALHHSARYGHAEDDADWWKH